jgi:hypothetical protein
VDHRPQPQHRQLEAAAVPGDHPRFAAGEELPPRLQELRFVPGGLVTDADQVARPKRDRKGWWSGLGFLPPTARPQAGWPVLARLPKIALNYPLLAAR